MHELLIFFHAGGTLVSRANYIRLHIESWRGIKEEFPDLHSTDGVKLV
jgi:hypothetical protein